MCREESFYRDLKDKTNKFGLLSLWVNTFKRSMNLVTHSHCWEFLFSWLSLPTKLPTTVEEKNGIVLFLCFQTNILWSRERKIIKARYPHPILSSPISTPKQNKISQQMPTFSQVYEEVGVSPTREHICSTKQWYD